MDAVRRLVDEVIGLLQAGQFDEVCELFVAELRPLVSPAALAAAWLEAVDIAGGRAVAGDATLGAPHGGMVDVRVPLRAPHDTVAVVVSCTLGGALAALRIEDITDADASSKIADYVDRQRFEEVDLVIGEPPLDTPATLSLPGDCDPRPGVLVLGGSGPTDRDGTLGPFKPLRDVAWGLASRGIAVLRFDKITHSRPEVLAKQAAVTIVDEYLRHAEWGLQALREHERIDPEQLFVLGHSMGGSVAPRVARQSTDLAGLIILAGGAVPLHWTLVRQVRDMAGAAGPDKAQIETLVEQARLVDDPQLNVWTPRASLPLGLPASYWLDLRDDRPADVAATLPQPMLILQGGRDHQSTVTDDLSEWQRALERRDDVDIRIFPDDDHLFIPQTAVAPDGGDNADPTHVDVAVVQACAQWIVSVIGD